MLNFSQNSLFFESQDNMFITIYFIIFMYFNGIQKGRISIYYKLGLVLHSSAQNMKFHKMKRTGQLWQY